MIEWPSGHRGLVKGLMLYLTNFYFAISIDSQAIAKKCATFILPPTMLTPCITIVQCQNSEIISIIYKVYQILSVIQALISVPLCVGFYAILPSVVSCNKHYNQDTE